MGFPHRSGTPPPEWRALVSVEDWVYLSAHLDDERLGELLIVLRECHEDGRAMLIAEIRRLLPGFQPGHALVLALARVTHEAI